jgi:DNA-binding transcriptional ArsR family regulator
MSTSPSSSSAGQPPQNNPGSPRRPPEVDKYVDNFLSVVCDTSRRYILELLAMPDGEENDEMLPEKRSGDIARAIGLSAATTSEHLRHLTRVGLVASRREGNMVYYRLRNRKLVYTFHQLLDALTSNYAAPPS